MIAAGTGVPRDRARGYALMVEVAVAGCPMAFDIAGQAYENGWGVQQSYRRAAQWYLKRGAHWPAPAALSSLLRQYPLECAPLGEWMPELTPLVPHCIFQSLRTAMLLCKRNEVPRYVALLIASYVCTEGEEWAQLQPHVDVTL